VHSAFATFQSVCSTVDLFGIIMRFVLCNCSWPSGVRNSTIWWQLCSSSWFQHCVHMRRS